MARELSESDIAKLQIRQQQQQIDNDPNAIHSDIMRDERVGNLLDQLNPDHLMTDIEHRIRGEKKDVYTGRWIPMVKNKKEVSEKMISNFMSFLGSILNQNTAMSNFSVDEVNNLMQMIISYVGVDLTINDQEYGIEDDYAEMWRIANIVCISCFSTFKQALNGMRAKRIFASLRIDASLNKEKQPGIKDALMFWK